MNSSPFITPKSLSGPQLSSTSSFTHLIHLIFIILALGGFIRVSAQSCEDIPEQGPGSISASITFNGTSATVNEGMVVRLHEQ